MPKTTTRRRLRVGAAIAVVAITAAILAGSGGAETPPAVVLPESGSVAAIQKQFTDVVARVSPMVVQIQTEQGLGSGIVYDADGDVVTNAHVTSGAKRFVVTLANGERHAAKLVGADPGDDLAVIHMSGATPDPASFGDSSKRARRRHLVRDRQSAGAPFERHPGDRVLRQPQCLRRQRRHPGPGHPDER